MSAPLRVLVVEDAPSTVRFLRAVLGCVASLDVVCETSTGYDAVRMAHILVPDVILLDLSLPDGDGADILTALLSQFPNPKVVILSGRASVAGPSLVSQGATGFISKGLSPDELVRQLSVVLGLPLVLVPVPRGPQGNPDGGSASGESVALEPAPSSPTWRVLIVEDVPSSLSILRGVLGCVAFVEVVGEAGTGYDAVRLADDLRPDLVLLDLSLPDADGADMLFNLMDVAPEARVIVLSSRADVAGPEMVAQGATGFIQKGLKPEELVRQLSALLDLTLSLVPASEQARADAAPEAGVGRQVPQPTFARMEIARSAMSADWPARQAT
jgi:DNA-binding NarL/FixJ family response regulator